MNLFEAGSAIQRLEILFDKLEYLLDIDKLDKEETKRLEYLHNEAIQLIDAEEGFDTVLDLTDKFNNQWEKHIMDLIQKDMMSQNISAAESQ